MIHWLDSCDVSGWKRLSEWQGVRSLECVSVGFVIAEDATTKTVASHIAYPADDDSQATGIMVIPVAAITKTTVLSNPASLASA